MLPYKPDRMYQNLNLSGISNNNLQSRDTDHVLVKNSQAWV